MTYTRTALGVLVAAGVVTTGLLWYEAGRVAPERVMAVDVHEIVAGTLERCYATQITTNEITWTYSATGMVAGADDGSGLTWYDGTNARAYKTVSLCSTSLAVTRVYSDYGTANNGFTVCPYDGDLEYPAGTTNELSRWAWNPIAQGEGYEEDMDSNPGPVDGYAAYRGLLGPFARWRDTTNRFIWGAYSNLTIGGVLYTLADHSGDVVKYTNAANDRFWTTAYRHTTAPSGDWPSPLYRNYPHGPFWLMDTSIVRGALSSDVRDAPVLELQIEHGFELGPRLPAVRKLWAYDHENPAPQYIWLLDYDWVMLGTTDPQSWYGQKQGLFSPTGLNYDSAPGSATRATYYLTNDTFVGCSNDFGIEAAVTFSNTWPEIGLIDCMTNGLNVDLESRWQYGWFSDLSNRVSGSGAMMATVGSNGWRITTNHVAERVRALNKLQFTKAPSVAWVADPASESNTVDYYFAVTDVWHTVWTEPPGEWVWVRSGDEQSYYTLRQATDKMIPATNNASGGPHAWIKVSKSVYYKDATETGMVWTAHASFRRGKLKTEGMVSTNTQRRVSFYIQPQRPDEADSNEYCGVWDYSGISMPTEHVWVNMQTSTYSFASAFTSQLYGISQELYWWDQIPPWPTEPVSAGDDVCSGWITEDQEVTARWAFQYCTNAP